MNDTRAVQRLISGDGRRIERWERPGSNRTFDLLALDRLESVASRAIKHRSPGRSGIAAAWWHYVTDFQSALRVEEGMPGPRELVHSERESFFGGYTWQCSGRSVWVRLITEGVRARFSSHAYPAR